MAKPSAYEVQGNDGPMDHLAGAANKERGRWLTCMAKVLGATGMVSGFYDPSSSQFTIDQALVVASDAPYLRWLRVPFGTQHRHRRFASSICCSMLDDFLVGYPESTDPLYRTSNLGGINHWFGNKTIVCAPIIDVERDALKGAVIVWLPYTFEDRPTQFHLFESLAAILRNCHFQGSPAVSQLQPDFLDDARSWDDMMLDGSVDFETGLCLRMCFEMHAEREPQFPNDCSHSFAQSEVHEGQELSTSVGNVIQKRLSGLSMGGSCDEEHKLVLYPNEGEQHFCGYCAHVTRYYCQTCAIKSKCCTSVCGLSTDRGCFARHQSGEKQSRTRLVPYPPPLKPIARSKQRSKLRKYQSTRLV